MNINKEFLQNKYFLCFGKEVLKINIIFNFHQILFKNFTYFIFLEIIPLYLSDFLLTITF
jgi:hypothetical protein